jgi:2-polyprenyl-3-methyl-5-hydroxy-6-metoxy-1,4-benzoquinol methylase
MDNSERKNHWENIYQTKELKDVSWYQPKPHTSLDIFKQFEVAKDAKIIDMGGGDGYLVDHLLDLGFHDITVVDISSKAIERAKQRLGDKAKNVKWIISDMIRFEPTEAYDFWHDRAAFHFLTDENEITHYLEIVEKSLKDSGMMMLGTFSEQGPKKCSGIEIKQYSVASLKDRLKKYFTMVHSLNVDHVTPFDTVQNFIFGCFRKQKSQFVPKI